MDYIYTGNENVSPKDLQHWKYLKKYRSPKTGKWIYVYARKKTLKQIDTHNKLAKSEEDWANRWYKEGSEFYNKGRDDLASFNFSNARFEEEKAKHNRDIANHLIEAAADEPVAKIATKISETIDSVNAFLKEKGLK